MAYTDWDVVAFEQPTAAKWNQLGENDEGLRDGSNVLWNNNQEIQAKSSGGATKKFLRLDNDDLMRLSQLPRQNDDNNTPATAVQEDVLIQYGWQQIVGNGTTSISAAVTFPVAFANTPIVVAGGLSAHTAVATDIDDLASVQADMNAIANTVSNTGFTLNLNRSSAFGATAYYAGSWIAIGTKA